MLKLSISTCLIFLILCASAQNQSLSVYSRYDELVNCQFLSNLHSRNNKITCNNLLVEDSIFILAQYAASHPETMSTATLRAFLEKNQDPLIVFALSQHQETEMTNWLTQYGSQITDDTQIALLGKCIRSKEDAIQFRQLKNHHTGYSLGLYYAMRNGFFFDFWISDLIQILSNQVQNAQENTAVCRAIRAIPANQYPQSDLDSLLHITPISFWNNRMAIQMIGKIKTGKSIETLLDIALIEHQSESLLIEAISQLQKQPSCDATKLQPLLKHQNVEIVELVIDCIIKQNKFDIPVEEIAIDANKNRRTSQAKHLFWKVQSFQIQKNPNNQEIIENIWQAFNRETNPYHRMIAFSTIQNCPSLFSPLLHFITQSNNATDLYYGTSCLIAMNPERLLHEGFESLWNIRDEGVDALLFEFLRNQTINKEQQKIFLEKIHLRIPDYILPKMIETRNEAAMTLAHWGDSLSLPVFYNSGLNWTPEQLASLPNHCFYRLLTIYDQQIDTIDFVVVKESNPLTALHFSKLVAEDFYNNKFFHRRVSNFVLQGGCPRGDGMGSLDYTISSEFSPTHFDQGSIGWASAGAHTESCQFFFMLDEAYSLDGRYTNMGHVTQGIEKLKTLPLGTQIIRIDRLN